MSLRTVKIQVENKHSTFNTHIHTHTQKWTVYKFRNKRRKTVPKVREFKLLGVRFWLIISELCAFERKMMS